MTDLLAWFGLKRFPFDKNIKTADVLDTEAVKECAARLDYIKRRGGIILISRRNYNYAMPGSWISKALRISRCALVTSVRI